LTRLDWSSASPRDVPRRYCEISGSPKSPTLQLDGGVNLGLNRATPGVQAYVGVSHRF
jgi:hypothetical protein